MATIARPEAHPSVSLVKSRTAPRKRGPISPIDALCARVAISGRVAFDDTAQFESLPDIEFRARLESNGAVFTACYDMIGRDGKHTAPILTFQMRRGEEMVDFTPDVLTDVTPEAIRSLGATLIALADGIERDFPAREEEARELEEFILAHIK